MAEQISDWSTTSSNKRPKISADEQKLELSLVGRGNDIIGTRGLLAFNGYIRERYCDTGERNEFCRDDKNIFRLYMYIPPFFARVQYETGLED